MRRRLALATVCLLAGCGGAGPGRPIERADGLNLRLEPALYNLRPGERVALTATIAPADDDVRRRYRVFWSIDGRPADSLISPGNTWVRLFSFDQVGVYQAEFAVRNSAGATLAAESTELRVWNF